MSRYIANASQSPRLGDVSSTFPTSSVAGDSTHVNINSVDVLNLGDSLRAAQGRLSTLTAALLQNPSLRTPDIVNALNSQQAALADLIPRYVQAYTAIFGQAPAGLGNPILIAAAVAVILAYVATNLYLWYQKQAVLETQAQAAVLAEQNRQSLLVAAAQKQQEATTKAAAGDQTGAADAQNAANALYQEAGTPGLMQTTAQPPPPPDQQDFATWAKNNWPLIAIAGVGLIFLPKLMGR